MIYLDMDGVITDFYKAVAQVANIPVEEVISKTIDHPHIEDFVPEIWDKVNFDFWVKMPELPWAFDLYNYLNDFDEVFFLSRPLNDVTCSAGKTAWLINRFGNKFDNYIFTRHKYLLAQPGAILIDDDPDNIESFKENAGEAIQFPVPTIKGYPTETDISNFKNDFEKAFRKIEKWI